MDISEWISGAQPNYCFYNITLEPEAKGNLEKKSEKNGKNKRKRISLVREYILYWKGSCSHEISIVMLKHNVMCQHEWRKSQTHFTSVKSYRKFMANESWRIWLLQWWTAKTIQPYVFSPKQYTYMEWATVKCSAWVLLWIESSNIWMCKYIHIKYALL